MNKKILIIFASLFFINLVMHLIFAQTNLSLTPSSVSVTNGNEFNINVNIENITDLYGFQFDLQFDSSILEHISSTEGGFLKNDGNATIFGEGNSSAGYLDNVFASRYGTDYGTSSSGVLAIIKFKAIGVGSSSIEIVNDRLVNSSVNPANYTMNNISVSVQAVNNEDGGGGSGSGGGRSLTPSQNITDVNESINVPDISENQTGEDRIDDELEKRELVKDSGYWIYIPLVIAGIIVLIIIILLIKKFIYNRRINQIVK